MALELSISNRGIEMAEGVGCAEAYRQDNFGVQSVSGI